MKRSRTLAAAALAVVLSLNVAPAAVAAPWDSANNGTFSRILKLLKKTLWIGNNTEQIAVPK